MSDGGISISSPMHLGLGSFRVVADRERHFVSQHDQHIKTLCAMQVLRMLFSLGFAVLCCPRAGDSWRALVRRDDRELALSSRPFASRMSHPLSNRPRFRSAGCARSKTPRFTSQAQDSDDTLIQGLGREQSQVQGLDHAPSVRGKQRVSNDWMGFSMSRGGRPRLVYRVSLNCISAGLGALMSYRRTRSP